MIRRPLPRFLLSLAAVSTRCAMGLEEFEDMVPNNGLLVYKGERWEASGHVSADGESPKTINGFGADFASTQGSEPWLSVCGRCGGLTLCEFDSDGDGQSNGLEMGDPCCQWRVGSGTTGVSASLISHPGYADATTTATMPASCPTRVVVSELPTEARRAAGLGVALAVWFLAVLISVVLVRCARMSRPAETLRYKTLGPAWRIKQVLPIAGEWWFQALDVAGLRDLPTEAMLMSPAQLLVFIAVLLGVILAAAIKLAEASGRNIPTTAKLSVGGGHAAELLFALSVVPVTRTSVWIHVFGISFERGIRFHRWIARLAILATGVHLVTMDNAGYDYLEPTGYTDGVGGNLWGFLSFIAALLILVTSLEPVRRKLFELFYYLHVPLALVCLVLGALHARYLKYLLILPAVLYAFDLVMRIYLGRFRGATLASVATLPSGDGGTITQLEVAFRSGENVYRHEPGGYCWVCIPSVSSFQWHPFSVTYLVDAGRILFHIKGAPDGQFSARIAQAAAAGQTVYVDGPYGNPGVPIEDYPAHLYVSGGIGATPMISLAQATIAHQATARVHFCWCLRHLESAAFLVPVLEELARAAGGDRVSFSFYITGRKSGGGRRQEGEQRQQQQQQRSGVTVVNQHDNATYTEQNSSTGNPVARPSQSSYYSQYDASHAPTNTTSGSGSRGSNTSFEDDGGRRSPSRMEGGAMDHRSGPHDGAVLGPVPEHPEEVEARLARIGRIVFARPADDMFIDAARHCCGPNTGYLGGKIAVYACGPEPLLDLTINGARRYTGPESFFVHTETFLL